MKTTIALTLVLTLSAKAGDIYAVLNTRDGHSYTNAEISSVTAAYAVVWYGEGSGVKIQLSNLPEDVQKKYNFNPAKATAEIDAIAMKKQAVEQAKQDAYAAQQEAVKDRMFRWIGDKLVPIASFKNLRGEISQVLPDGILLSEYVEKAMRIGIYNSQQAVGGMYSPGAGGTTWQPSGNLIFIHCPTAGYTDGQQWVGCGYRAGIYKYDAVTGAVTTVSKYDTGLSYLTKSDAVLKYIPGSPIPASRSINNGGYRHPISQQ